MSKKKIIGSVIIVVAGVAIAVVFPRQAVYVAGVAFILARLI